MTEYSMASAANERPAPTTGLRCCTSNGQKIVATPIISLAFNFVLLQFLISVLCAGDAVAAMENNPPADVDLASYEGRYPKDLFNKTVVANGQTIGRVAKEADELIVVFGDSNNSRFDVPKSKVTLAGGSVAVKEPSEQYEVDREAPLPERGGIRRAGE